MGVNGLVLLRDFTNFQASFRDCKICPVLTNANYYMYTCENRTILLLFSKLKHRLLDSLFNTGDKGMWHRLSKVVFFVSRNCEDATQ